MTLRHLKIFLEVADTGTMSTAAKNLYITQPSVTQAIHELESHFHVLLLSVFPKSCTSQRRESSFTDTPDRSSPSTSSSKPIWQTIFSRRQSGWELRFRSAEAFSPT